MTSMPCSISIRTMAIMSTNRLRLARSMVRVFAVSICKSPPSHLYSVHPGYHQFGVPRVALLCSSQ